MPNVLTLKPDDVDTVDKRSKYSIAVVGCNRKGVFYASAFAGAGFKVSCSDADPNAVKKLAKGKTPFGEQEIEHQIKLLIKTGQLSVTSELKKSVSASDIIVLTVPASLDEKNKTDSSEAVNTLKQVGAALHAGVLVVYGEVAGLGFVEGKMRETLENTSGLKAGQDFILAYVPTQNPQGKLLLEPKAGLRLRVAADGQTGRNVASTLFKTIADSVIQVKDVKTAEAAALFAVAKRDADAALANELAVFCEQAGVDYYEALKASGLDNPSFLPGADDDETKKEAYLLLEGAENLDAKLRLPELARQINEDIVKHSVNLTQDALRSCDKTLRRARIAVLGTIKPAGNSAVFVKALMLKGAKVSLHDPASRSDASELGLAKTSLNEAIEGADCIVLLTSEEPPKPLNLRRLKALTKTPSVMVDLTGSLDRGAVESEGFIYRGLGRGTGKE